MTSVPEPVLASALHVITPASVSVVPSSPAEHVTETDVEHWSSPSRTETPEHDGSGGASASRPSVPTGPHVPETSVSVAR